jgi:hypothetical protein
MTFFSRPKNPARPRLRTPRGIRIAVIAVLSGLLLSVFAATSASAIVSTGPAVGYSSPTSGLWIGSYRLADGQAGFCLNLGRPSPRGADFTPVDIGTLGWYSADDTARLAYIARTWGSTADANVAAAGQLATWMITGLNGHSPAELAARAGASAEAVLNAATTMLAETNGATGASRGVNARTIVERGDDGTDTVRAELDVDYLAGVSTVPAGMHRGFVTLEGATFTDGSTRTEVGNGERVAIRPSTGDAIVHVAAHAEFDSLPYGEAATVAHNQSDVQNLLLGSTASAHASAKVNIERPTPLPFQPTVVTRTSEHTATAGAAITDLLSVSARATTSTAAESPAQNVSSTNASAQNLSSQKLSTKWGVFGPDGGPYTPVPVTVHSTLLGPFDTAPVRADAPPADAPIACEVDTVVDHGPGDYETEPCTLREAGYYVWVERIESTDTPAEQGGARIQPWRSAFGVSDEISFVPETAVLTHELAQTGSSVGYGVIALAGGSILAGLLLAFGPIAVRRAAPRVVHSVA